MASLEPVEVSVFIRAAGVAGVVVLLSACGGPDKSPFVLWWEGDAFGRPTGGIRTGMPLDSLEQFWIQRDGLRENANVWDRCAPVDAGARRCERGTVTPRGRFDVVASADGRVVYLAFAPATRDIIFDDSLTWMQRPWWRTRGTRLDPQSVMRIRMASRSFGWAAGGHSIPSTASGARTRFTPAPAPV